MGPTFDEERALLAQGYRLIAGIDEAGRGPLAGPVVAAAVILPADTSLAWLRLLDDSKKLPALRREFLNECISKEALAMGVAAVPCEEIDARGILPATRLAMSRAVQSLSCTPDFLLLDAVKLPEVALPQRSIIRGDGTCLSISAASVVAKVHRDRLMNELDRQYPGYGFAKHKGYATPEHLQQLRRRGPCPLHRRSFAPVRHSLGVRLGP